MIFWFIINAQHLRMFCLIIYLQFIWQILYLLDRILTSTNHLLLVLMKLAWICFFIWEKVVVL